MMKSAIAGAVLSMVLITSAASQTSSSGTAGAANAAAASPGGVPSMSGTAPGSTSPGGINGVPSAPQSAPPTANDQVPNPGPMLNSTVPPGPAGVSAGGGSRTSSSGTVGSSAPQQSQKDMDKALDDSLDQKVKTICKGC